MKQSGNKLTLCEDEVNIIADHGVLWEILGLTLNAAIPVRHATGTFQVGKLSTLTTHLVEKKVSEKFWNGEVVQDSKFHFKKCRQIINISNELLEILLANGIGTNVLEIQLESVPVVDHVEVAIGPCRPQVDVGLKVFISLPNLTL